MKPNNWRTDYDWRDPEDYPVQDDKMFDIQSEEELMLPHEIKAPSKGIKSLDEGQRFAEADPIEAKIQELMAQGLSRELAEVLVKSGISEDSYEIMNKRAQGGRIGYAYGDEDPEVVEDDLTTMEFMKDQGVPYGEQASGIDKNILIEKVVEEFIKRKGRKPRNNDEIIEFYMEEMAGGSAPQKVAYNPGDYDPILVEEYEKYKWEQQEQGLPIISIDEFMQMERFGVRAGGLPGILGV